MDLDENQLDDIKKDKNFDIKKLKFTKLPTNYFLVDRNFVLSKFQCKFHANFKVRPNLFVDKYYSIFTYFNTDNVFLFDIKIHNPNINYSYIPSLCGFYEKLTIFLESNEPIEEIEISATLFYTSQLKTFFHNNIIECDI
jgi:hypothetical protein